MSKNLKIFLSASLIGTLGLLSFYFLTLYWVTKSFVHPYEQFLNLQPWMGLLVIGFGLQTGIFWLLRKGVRLNIGNKAEATIASGSSAAISGTSMAACCAHHVVDVLPILGFSGLAIFLTQYQTQLLISGVIINFFSLIFMLWILLGKPNSQNIISIISKK